MSDLDIIVGLAVMGYACYQAGKSIGIAIGMRKQFMSRQLEDLKDLNESLTMLSKAKQEFDLRKSEDDS